MISFNPSAATPLLLLMGVVATVGVHQAFLWFGHRREALHPWVVAWCANTLPSLPFDVEVLDRWRTRA